MRLKYSWFITPFIKILSLAAFLIVGVIVPRHRLWAQTIVPMSVYVMPSANAAVDLYSGPGSDFSVTGKTYNGQVIPIVQISADGQWYHLSSGPRVVVAAVNNPPPPQNLWPLTPVAQSDPYVESIQTATQAAMAVEPTPIPVQPTATPVPVDIVQPEMLTATPIPVVETPTATPPSVNQSTGQPFVCTGGCAVAPDPSCNIKGNVNSSGERIYHTTDSQYYERTDVKPEEGDTWFCTVLEAENAGFRAPQN